MIPTTLTSREWVKRETVSQFMGKIPRPQKTGIRDNTAHLCTVKFHQFREYIQRQTET